MGARKVGGIWFLRAWRFRLSFCIARPANRLTMTD